VFRIGLKPHPDLVDEDSPALERCQEDWAAVKKSTGRVKPPDSGTDETKNRPDLSPPAGKRSRKIFDRGIGDHVLVPKSPGGRWRLLRGERRLRAEVTRILDSLKALAG
jgi:hypothetical protein